jgi:hypothetical protein
MSDVVRIVCARPTAGQRLRARQQEAFELGYHPATGVRLLVGTSETCGDCRFRKLYGYHTRSYPKCENPRARIAHSEATDVRASWPACRLFERADG